MHMITSTARRPNASTRSEPSLSSARVHVKTRIDLGRWRLSARAARLSDWWRRSGRGSFAFAGQPAVYHLAAFCWHASSKKNRPSWCLFPFRLATVLPLRAAWIAVGYPFAESLRDVLVQRQRCWKRGSGDGQRLSLWDYGTTERFFNAVDRRGSTVCKAIGGSR